jgi:quercetin dioxygenase-like cupin family protein
VSDLVVNDDLPPEVLSSGAAWAGCIAGALSEQVFADKLHRAGLVDIELSERHPLSLDDVALYPLFTPEVLDLMRRLLPPDTRRHIATSVIARARKPTTSVRPTRGPGVAAMVQNLDDIADVAETPGVTAWRLKKAGDVELKIVDIEPGQATSLHTHMHAHQGLVVAGTGMLQLDDGRQLPLQPSDVFSIPPNQSHAIGSDGPGSLRLVCMDCFVDST